MIVFGNRAFKDIILVKWGHKGEVLNQHDWCPYTMRKRHHDAQNTGQAMRKHGEEMAIFQPRREASGKAKFADTWVLNFQPPDL